MYQSTTTVTVRYAETDQMSFVYYGNYAGYYEVGRAEAVRQLGLSYKQLENEEGVLMPVKEMNCLYRSPAYYDDRLRLVTSIKELPTRLITFHTDIYSPADKLINQGRVSLFFVKRDTGKVCHAPEKLLALLRPYFNA